MDVEEFVKAEEIADLLKEIIKVESVGKLETKVAEIIIDRLEKEGITSYKLIESEEGRGNLIIEIDGGAGEGYNLMIVGHSDVVPAGKNWSVDPFGGIERDGYIYGRGAIDDKGQVAVMTYLAILLKRMNFKFRGKLKLLIAADEETQMPEHGVRFLMKNHPEIFKDVDGAIGELGGRVDFGGKKGQMIIFGEKSYATFKITFRGPGGHSSQPYRTRNPIIDASRYINSLPDGYFFISKPVKIMLRKLFGLKSLFLTNKLFNKLVLKTVKNEKIAKLLHSYTHVTIAKTILRAGEKDNVIPDHAELYVNMRGFPELDAKDLEKILLKYMPKGIDFEIKNEKFVESTYSDIKDRLYKAIEKTVKEMGYEPFPIIMSATSDSVWLRKMGIPVFHIFTTKRILEWDRVHGVDERIHKEDLIEALKGYLYLIKNLSK